MKIVMRRQGIERLGDVRAPAGAIGRAALSLLLAGGLAACETAAPEITTHSVSAVTSLPTPGEKELESARTQFVTGNFGLAENHYRRAIELEPGNVAAWLGLAASYDQIRRFDLADQAYSAVQKLTGNTVSLLNNRGYSQLLRGNLAKARRNLMEANRRAPDHEHVRSNLEILNKALIAKGQEPVVYPDAF